MHVLIDGRKLADFGIGTYIRGLVTAVAGLRPDWRLSVMTAPEHRDDPIWERSNVDPVLDSSANYSWRELRAGSRQAHAVSADLFHAPHYVYPRGLPCPGVVTIHDCIHLRFPDYLPRPLGVLPRRLSLIYARRMMRFAATEAAHVITVSRATRDDVATRLGIDAAKISAVPNGGGVEAIEAHAGDQPHPEAGLVPNRGRQVLFVGNPKPHKNLGGLLSAFALVARDLPDVRLVLAGPERPLESVVASHPQIAELRSRITNLGFLSEAGLRDAYRRATLLCMPSYYEGFGLPALEAMAAGTPVLAADSGGLPEVLGDAGLLVDPGSVEGLANALREALEDEARLARLAQAGLERAAGFSWHRSAEATIAVYERAVRSRR